MEERRRCRWCNPNNPIYVEYHDNEWGLSSSDERYLYEMLILESFQAGLSWECVLNKREAFREAYEGFDIRRVCAFDEKKMDELACNPLIIRNRRKIRASVQNSKVFLEIKKEFGSFYAYLSTFTKGQVIYENDRTTSALSDALSEDLRRRGMTFVGSTIVYSYLQAIGAIDSHEEGCFLYKARKL